MGEEPQRPPDAESRSLLVVVVAVTGHEVPSPLATVAMAVRLIGFVGLRPIGVVKEVEGVVVAQAAPGGVAHVLLLLARA